MKVEFEFFCQWAESRDAACHDPKSWFHNRADGGTTVELISLTSTFLDLTNLHCLKEEVDGYRKSLDERYSDDQGNTSARQVS